VEFLVSDGTVVVCLFQLRGLELDAPSERRNAFGPALQGDQGSAAVHVNLRDGWLMADCAVEVPQRLLESLLREVEHASVVVGASEIAHIEAARVDRPRANL